MIQVVTSALPPLGMRLANAAARLAEVCASYSSVAAQFGSPLHDMSGALEGYETGVTAALGGQASQLAVLGLALVAAGSVYAGADARAIVPPSGVCAVPAPLYATPFSMTPYGNLDGQPVPQWVHDQ
ncbi:MAG: hypothetical protein ACXV3F_08935 [Frankiaceae bacterium]